MISELSKYWITEPGIDFELKKYQLLGYLKFVEQNLEEDKIFPFFHDVQEHYRMVKNLKKSKMAFLQSMQSEIESIDIKKLEIHHKEKKVDTLLLKEIDQILEFSMEKLSDFKKTLLKHYKELMQTINVEGIGISPLYKQEGYILINSANRINVFGYKVDQVTPITRLKTHYIDSYSKGVTNTYENIKLDLMSSNKEMPNPATYAIKSSKQLPLYETLLPLSSNVVYNYIQSR